MSSNVNKIRLGSVTYTVLGSAYYLKPESEIILPCGITVALFNVTSNESNVCKQSPDTRQKKKSYI